MECARMASLARIMQVAGLIGDVVASRRAESRGALQDRLVAVLEDISGRTGRRLAVTLGDEFQGRFESVAQALGAAWHLHLSMMGTARLRIGVGWGEILVEPEEGSPFGQDGPAWWRSRDAIERVDASHPARTLVVTETGWDDLLNAYLTLRDAHLDDLDEADAVILACLEAGETQRAAAERLGMHESSVSRRVGRRHLSLLLRVATVDVPSFHG